MFRIRICFYWKHPSSAFSGLGAVLNQNLTGDAVSSASLLDGPEAGCAVF